jgi:hypothetical protein
MQDSSCCVTILTATFVFSCDLLSKGRALQQKCLCSSVPHATLPTLDVTLTELQPVGEDT